MQSPVPNIEPSEVLYVVVSGRGLNAGPDIPRAWFSELAAARYEVADRLGVERLHVTKRRIGNRYLFAPDEATWERAGRKWKPYQAEDYSTVIPSHDDYGKSALVTLYTMEPADPVAIGSGGTN